MTDYKPLPIVVKYITPNCFADVKYRSFRTLEDAENWLKEPFGYCGINYDRAVYIEKYAIYVRRVHERTTEENCTTDH